MERGTSLHVQGFHHHRELGPVILEGCFADHPLEVSLHEVADRIAAQPPFPGHRIDETQIRQFVFNRTPGPFHTVGKEPQGMKLSLFVFHGSANLDVKRKPGNSLEGLSFLQGPEQFSHSLERSAGKDLRFGFLSAEHREELLHLGRDTRTSRHRIIIPGNITHNVCF